MNGATVSAAVNGRRKGFTLVEALLGALILAIVSMAAGSILFGAAHFDRRARSLHAMSREARLAFVLMARDIENAVPWPRQVDGRLIASEGAGDRFSFYVAGGEGICRVSYVAGGPGLASTWTTRVRYLKSVREMFESLPEDVTGPAQYLWRLEVPVRALDAGVGTAGAPMVAASGLAPRGLSLRYGVFRDGPGGREVVFQDSWTSERLPDVVRVTVTLEGGASGAQGQTFTRDLYPAVREVVL